MSCSRSGSFLANQNHSSSGRGSLEHDPSPIREYTGAPDGSCPSSSPHKDSPSVSSASSRQHSHVSSSSCDLLSPYHRCPSSSCQCSPSGQYSPVSAGNCCSPACERDSSAPPDQHKSSLASLTSAASSQSAGPPEGYHPHSMPSSPDRNLSCTTSSSDHHNPPASHGRLALSN